MSAEVQVGQMDDAGHSRRTFERDASAKGCASLLQPANRAQYYLPVAHMYLMN
jgi:hypothetical protein